MPSQTLLPPCNFSLRLLYGIGIICLFAQGRLYPAPAATAFVPPVDSIKFGDIQSESIHQVKPDHSDTIKGGLDETARRLLPLGQDWQGGKVSFAMKVDPVKPNYFTVKLWGSDKDKNFLLLFCEGKQVGYRHLGDIDVLFAGNGAPPDKGLFFYVTTPLPLAMTAGRHDLQLEIRATGPIWGYGGTWDKYQKPMTEPTCGIYRAYTHTEECFSPSPEEKQGSSPADPPVRQSPGQEVITDLKTRESRQIAQSLESKDPLDQMQVELIAKAWHVKWSPAYHNDVVVKQITKAADEYFRNYRKDPKIAESDPGRNVYNGGWLGLGPLANAVRLVGEALHGVLNDKIDDGSGKSVVRRDAWSEMFRASRDWHLHNRRQYTNQSMITDLYFYLDNRAIAAIDAANALPEDRMRHYLYQSVGIEPWLGSEGPHGPEKPLGEHYFELTPKGLTKELGFVGYYGEVLDWTTSIYLATTEPEKPEAGDEKIKQQLIRIEKARSYFRYPALDDEGNRAMRAETIVGWRDEGHYPGDITYGERPTWDASAIYCAAAVLSTEGIGAFQQMVADNQFYATLERQLKERNLRTTAGVLGLPDQYEVLKAQSETAVRLPMTRGQPDFAWADEEDGVVAVKHGDEILYASLYWRARTAINFLARVHFITPSFDRIAVVREETEFAPSGLTYSRPDWVNMGFGNGGLRYPGDLHSAFTGEKLPIAKIPDGVAFKVGDESPYAGRGSFYRLRYGNFLIGMNCTNDKSYTLKVETDQLDATDLVSGRQVSLAEPVKVPPMTTVVLRLGKAR